MTKEKFSIPTMHQKAAPKRAAGGNLTVAEFDELSATVKEYSGIILSETKRIHVEIRVNRRIQQLGLPSFGAYLKYLRAAESYEREVKILMDIVTTNKTDFFREPAHFDFLRKNAIHEISSLRPYEPIKIWSAGCSSGEEPYSLAITMLELEKLGLKQGFEILASDISTAILTEAVTGVYELEKIEEVPLAIKQQYFLKSKESVKPLVRVAPQVRAKVSFVIKNLISDIATIQRKFDLIFCRNVIIYFDKTTQEQVVQKLAGQLMPGGYLFLGHSETILGMNVPLERVASTIYRRINK